MQQLSEGKLSLMATRLRERKPPQLSMAPMIDCVFSASDFLYGIYNFCTYAGNTGTTPTSWNAFKG